MVAYSFKKQFIEPIMVGIGYHPNCFGVGADRTTTRPKRQTIRAVGRRRHARPGETIQLYTAMRTKQCRKLGEARCVSVEPIRIFMSGWINLGDRTISGGDNGELGDFARSDGFSGWSEMKKFWLDNHGEEPFSGVLIKWEPMA